MNYQRHVGRFLVFPVCGVRLNLQDLCSFPYIYWPSSYACWANFHFLSRPRVRLCLCSLMRSKTLLVSPMWHLPHSHGTLCTHCFFWWASPICPVFINDPRSVCLVLNMVLTLKRLPMRLNFSETPLTFGTMIVTLCAVSEEGRLLSEYFIMESVNSCGCSVSVRSCLMFLISLLKPFWSWHMTLALMIKLWTTFPLTWCG
jgi:hypothetical protein